MSFFEVRQIKSVRKACRCYWCGETINLGEPKTATAAVYDSDFQSTNFHPECYNALERWHDLYPREWEWPEPWSMQRGEVKEKGES